MGKVICKNVNSGGKLEVRQKRCKRYLRLCAETECKRSNFGHKVSPKKLRAALAQCVNPVPAAAWRKLCTLRVPLRLFPISNKDCVFKSNQGQTTKPHGGKAFLYVLMLLAAAEWGSVVHVNDPFIVSITDVNHRKPNGGCIDSLPWVPLLYAWSHVVWRVFHPALFVSQSCHRLTFHLHAYA